jgi:predicted RNA binding protein YcfA (HicA-like mRNA interferase family)
VREDPEVIRSAVIPNHPGDIPAGTMRAILKQLRIERDQLDSV